LVVLFLVLSRTRKNKRKEGHEMQNIEISKTVEPNAYQTVPDQKPKHSSGFDGMPDAEQVGGNMKDKNYQGMPTQAQLAVEERYSPVAEGKKNNSVYGTPTVVSKVPNSPSSLAMQQMNLNERSPWKIVYGELEFIGEIGKGGYGTVFRSKWRETVVAVKVLDSKINMSASQLQDLRMEAGVMARMRPHYNVLLLLGVCTVSPPYCIVTEYMDGGSLYALLMSDKKIDNSDIVKIIKGVGRGLLHLHMEGVVHRDLAARNILLKETKDGFEPKISDFGLSRLLDTEDQTSSTTNSDVGPLKIMAPECILNKEYSVKSDVWAFSILLAEIYTRREPYDGLTGLQVAGKVSRGELTHPIPPNAPQLVQEVMKDSLQFKAEARPEMKPIVSKLEQL